MTASPLATPVTTNAASLMKSDPSIAVIIVNYRTAQLAIDCLASLDADRGGEYALSVLVVDNASRDGSVERIAEAIAARGWGRWVSLLPLADNGGFARGNNRGVVHICKGPQPPDYLWLLNPDTVVRKGAIKALAAFLDAHPGVGIVGSRLEDLGGTPQVSAFRDHSPVSEFLSGMRLGVLDALLASWKVAPAPGASTPRKSDWVSGASMMVRRALFDQLGLLDERYFMYFEEVDFCIRARKAGWECWHVPASRVVHFEGAASGIAVAGERAARRPRYWFESRRRFFMKNYGRLTLLLADFLWVLGYGSWRIRRLVQGKPDLDPPHLLNDFFRESTFCRGFSVLERQDSPVRPR